MYKSYFLIEGERELLKIKEHDRVSSNLLLVELFHSEKSRRSFKTALSMRSTSVNNGT